MKEGTKVKVIDEVSGHEFDIGEIVERRFAQYDEPDSLGFYSEKNGLWYMCEEEYVVLDKNYTVELLEKALRYAFEGQKFSEETILKIDEALSAASQEV